MNYMTDTLNEVDNKNVYAHEMSKCAIAAEDVEEDAINLIDYLRVIYKYRKMILLVCAIAVISTAAVSLFLPKKYAATASVVPPFDILKKTDSTGSLSAVKNPLLDKMMDVTGITDMYVGILQSRSVADAIIERFDLADAYKIPNNITVVRQVLREGTSIEVTDEGIVQITVEDRDPVRAAALANAYVEELDRRNKLLFVGQAASKKVFLENRLKEIEQELSQIDNLLSRDARIKEMLFELLTREYEIAKIEEAKSMPTIQVLDSAVVPERKCRPERRKMVVIAGAASLFVAILAAFLRDYFNRLSLNVR